MFQNVQTSIPFQIPRQKDDCRFFGRCLLKTFFFWGGKLSLYPYLSFIFIHSLSLFFSFSFLDLSLSKIFLFLRSFSPSLSFSLPPSSFTVILSNSIPSSISLILSSLFLSPFDYLYTNFTLSLSLPSFPLPPALIKFGVGQISWSTLCQWNERMCQLGL